MSKAKQSSKDKVKQPPSVNQKIRCTTSRYRAIAEEYVKNGGSIFDAMVTVGYSKEYAKARGYEIIRKPQVAEYIEDLLSELRERNQVTVDKIIEEMAKIAFFDVTEAVNVKTKTSMIDGQPHEYQIVTIKDTDELTPEQRSAIKSIKQTKTGIAVEFYPRDAMLTKLGETLGMFKHNLNIQGSLETQNNPYEGLTTEELKKLVANKGG